VNHENNVGHDGAKGLVIGRRQLRRHQHRHRKRKHHRKRGVHGFELNEYEYMTDKETAMELSTMTDATAFKQQIVSSRNRNEQYPWGILESQADTPDQPWPTRLLLSQQQEEKNKEGRSDGGPSGTDADGSTKTNEGGNSYSPSACLNPKSFKGSMHQCSETYFFE